MKLIEGKDKRFKNISPLDIKVSFNDFENINESNYYTKFDSLLQTCVNKAYGIFNNKKIKNTEIIGFRKISISLPFYKFDIDILDEDIVFYTYTYKNEIKRRFLNQAQVILTEDDIINKRNEVYGDEDLTDVRLRSIYLSTYSTDEYSTNTIFNFLNKMIEFSTEEKIITVNNPSDLNILFDDNIEDGGEIIESYETLAKIKKLENKWVSNTKVEFDLRIKGQFLKN